mmetsp:Transcript_35581/g.74998  ORF Transcript_35581/g.74998 Transcript_35581/m.74998 type:complete len:680 (-) Transcript_35581:71-2110(-)
MSIRMMILRRSLTWPWLLPFLAIANAKLILWPSFKDEVDVTPENKPSHHGSDRGTIRERLKLFHKHGVNDSVGGQPAGQHGYSLSPAKYLDFMLLYLKNSIEQMTEYLYSFDQSSQPASSSAYALFRHSQYVSLKSEPKDAWEGIVSAFAALRTGYFSGLHSIIDGAYELGYGTISAFLSLLGTGRGAKNDNPNQFVFLSEFFYGLRRGTSHAADGIYLFAAGAVVGFRNLAVGVYRTPEAMRAYELGKMYYPQGKRPQDDQGQNGQKQETAVWDYYSLDYEDRDIRMEENNFKEKNFDFYSQNQRKTEITRNIRRRRANVSVKDMKYYDILGVEIDANSKEIRSAYRKEALKHHPDKQTASSSSPTMDASLADPHIEGFLDLTEAYRILSNDASRDAYDQHGLCFREEAMLPDDDSHEDYVDLIDELFGAAAVRNYVGNILIAPIVNELFGFTDNRKSSRQNVELQSLQQRRRVVDIAKYLREKVISFVRGECTMEDLTQSCRKEANFILQEGGEPTAAFLRLIGRTLMEEADQQTGHMLPFVRKTVSDSSLKVKSSIANARLYGPIYFRAALEGLVLGAHNGGENGDSGGCSGSRKSNKDSVDQHAVLDLLWQYVVNDTVVTLREASGKVFADRPASDTSLAFVQTPSMIKYQKTKKAKAIRILAREMMAASAAFGD